MYNVLDICRYIINYSNEKDYGISNLKLQKLLYFVQAYFLCFSPKKQPCFKEKIEAWDFGPVVPEAYHEYKQYGSGDIPQIDSFLHFDPNDIWETTRVFYRNITIRDEDKKMIQGVVDNFADFSATDLVTLTHNQSPWKDVYRSHQNNIITNDSIRRYFNEA